MTVAGPRCAVHRATSSPAPKNPTTSAAPTAAPTRPRAPAAAVAAAATARAATPTGTTAARNMEAPTARPPGGRVSGRRIRGPRIGGWRLTRSGSHAAVRRPDPRQGARDHGEQREHADDQQHRPRAAGHAHRDAAEPEQRGPAVHDENGARLR